MVLQVKLLLGGAYPALQARRVFLFDLNHALVLVDEEWIAIWHFD
jgi:hypothetical protein